MSEQICVQHVLYCGGFGVDCAFGLSISFVFVTACVPVWTWLCMHLLAWWHVCVSSEFKSVCVCVCVCDSYSEISGCWAVLSVDSLVSFGPTAPSNTGWSDEIWQTGTALCRELPHPIISPIMARLLQEDHKRLWELDHMLTNDSETTDNIPIILSPVISQTFTRKLHSGGNLAKYIPGRQTTSNTQVGQKININWEIRTPPFDKSCIFEFYVRS